MTRLKRLDVVRKLSQEKPKWIHKDIFRLLWKKEIWLLAYENIKKKNRKFLIDGIKHTFNKADIDKIENLQQKVINESYQFKPIKQALISKENGKMQTFKLSTIDDIIVQEVIQIILEAIFEPIFDNRSFGFRSGMGVHNALKYVDEEFSSMEWIIKSDQKLVFNNSILRSVLLHKIDDSRFLRLINKLLKNGTSFWKVGVDTNPATIFSNLGVPQETSISPILVNIYFDRFDKFITQKEIEYFSPNSSKRNLIYNQLIMEKDKKSNLLDKEVKIRYVRYAHQWMIGIKGPHILVKILKNEVENFFQRDLKEKFNLNKVKVIHLQSEKIFFLGYDIFLLKNQKQLRQKSRLRFQLPVKIIIQCLNERGYITYKKNKWKPISKSNYTILEDEIIVQHFQSVWLSFLNFYSGTTNISHLQYVHYLLHMSCAMTLAHRHRLSIKKIFKKHGKRLEILDQTKIPSKVLAYFPYKINWKVNERQWQIIKDF